MAKKRDVIIAVVIGLSFVVAMFFFGMIFIGLMSDDADFGFSGLGGDIGVVEIFGVINEETGRKAIEQIGKWADNSSIKGILIHINSPGGGVSISQEIYDAIIRARSEKPVVAAMASVAASGGVYIACAADRIVANQGTLTGSIGVIMQFHTAEGLLEKIGIGTETVKSGLMKDVGNYSRSMSEREKSMLQGLVNDTYEQFIEAVAIGRGMEVEEVRDFADGSIFTGLMAYNMGLVDTLGGLHEAKYLLAELAEIEGEPELVRPYERKDVSIFDLLGNAMGRITMSVEDKLTGPQLMYLYE